MKEKKGMKICQFMALNIDSTINTNQFELQSKHILWLQP